MKYLSLLIAFSSILCLSSFGQMNSKMLKVYCISEYIDGYVIKAVDTTSNDTLNIISPKEVVEKSKRFERIMVGNSYNFKYSNYLPGGVASAKSFVIRIKTTIIWRSEDRVEDRPVFSQNTRGLCIEINDLE